MERKQKKLSIYSFNFNALSLVVYHKWLWWEGNCVVCALVSANRGLKDQMLQVIQTPGQQTYLSKLLRYDYTIKYKFDSSNTVTNTLSRILAAKDT